MKKGHCDKCFVNLDKEEHKEWCPYHKKDTTVDSIREMFGMDNEPQL